MKRTKFKNSMVLLLCVLMLFGHPISTMAQSIPAKTVNAVDMQLESPIITPVSLHNASVVTDGLIFDFNMDEIKQGTGNNAGKKVIINGVDNSEYVINGQPKLDDFGIYNKSIEFDGTNTYVNLGRPNIHDQYTFEAWVNLKPGGGNSLNKIFGRDRTTVASDMFYFTVRNNGNIEYNLSDHSGKSYSLESGITNRVIFDTWNHVAITADKENVKLFLNGKKISEKSIVNANIDLDSNPLDLLLGCGYNASGTGLFNGHAFKGRMDAVKVYDYARTEQQVNEGVEDILNNIPPEIQGSSPKAGDLIDADGEFQVTYNMGISPGDAEVSLVDENGAAVQIDVSVQDRKSEFEGKESLVIKPKLPLQPGRKYTLNIPVGAVKSAAKGVSNKVAASYTFFVKQNLEGDAGNGDLSYWVERKTTTPSSIEEQGSKIVLSNGLVQREFDISQNFLTTEYKNLYTGVSLLDKNQLQSDIQVRLNDKYSDTGEGATLYGVGGTNSETIPTFKYKSYRIEYSTEEIFHWEWNPIISDPTMKNAPWPAKGKALIVTYVAGQDIPVKYQGVQFEVRYEIYDGLPAMSKYIKVTNTGAQDVIVQNLKNEVLPAPVSMKDALYIESANNAGNVNHDRNNGRHVASQWEDKGNGYGLLINQYAFNPIDNPNFAGMNSKEFGPAYRLAKDKTFNGYRVYELFHSSSYYEWQQLEIKKMYRVLFPQTTDNPLIYHLIASDSPSVKRGIDQAKEAGFNMVLLSFGSGANVEDISPANIARYKELCDYAHERNVLLGAYVMQVARSGGPDGSYNGIWGTMRDMTSNSAKDTLKNTLYFIEQTGLNALEIDGTYPGTISPLTTAGHEGIQDSITKQFDAAILNFFKELRKKNVYINAPDWMFPAGANKAVMGYQEAGFGAPRKQQFIYGRQINYFGTFGKMPSMGWTLVPFSSYNGGDSAVFWPYDERINDYDYIIGLNMMYGTSGSYRGANGLYQVEPSKKVIGTWGEFFNKYKGILNGDVVHIMKPEYTVLDKTKTKDIDGFIHTSPDADQKGMFVFFNQTGQKVTRKVKIPVYYTGLTTMKAPPVPVPGSHYDDDHGGKETGDLYPPDIPMINKPEGTPTDTKIIVSQGDMNGQEYTVDSNGDIEVEITLEDGTYGWYTVYSKDNNLSQNTVIPAPKNIYIVNSSTNQVNLAWDKVQMGGKEVKEYYVYRNDQFIGKAFTNSFTDKNVVANMTYKYEVVPVHNTVAGTKSNSVNVVTEEDLTPPTIDSVRALDGERVQVKFSEGLEATSAQNKTSYGIAGANISSVSLGTTTDTVIIKLGDRLEAFVPLILTVNNIKDASAKGNVILPNSTSNFVYGYQNQYNFEELDGAAAKDKFNLTDGTISGTPVREKGINGNALLFDGVRNYADIGQPVNGLNNYSVELWIKPEPGAETYTVAGQQRDAYDGWKWRMYVENGVLKFIANNGKGAYPGNDGKDEIVIKLSSGDSKMIKNDWNQCVIVKEADTYKLYLNGIEVASETKTGIDQAQNHYTMWLGAFRNMAGGEPTSQFKGLMDIVTVYNTSLTQNKVKELYDAVNVPASKTPQSTLTGLQQVSIGQTFDIKMGLTGVTQNVYQQMYAQDLMLHYDPANLKLDSVTSLKDGFKVIEQKELVPGHIRIVAASVGADQGVQAQGDLLSFTFTAKSAAREAETTLSVGNVVIANGEGNELQVDGASHKLQISISVDKSELNAAIAGAQAKHDAAVEGNEHGLYMSGSKAQLQSAIDAARATASDPNATQQQVDSAKAALDAAIQVFESKKISADVNGKDGITVGDLAIVAAAYGKQEGQPGWNPKADVNHDGKVDIEDLAIVAKAILQ